MATVNKVMGKSKSDLNRDRITCVDLICQ